jgi:hypothetical protein
VKSEGIRVLPKQTTKAAAKVVTRLTELALIANLLSWHRLWSNPAESHRDDENIHALPSGAHWVAPAGSNWCS